MQVKTPVQEIMILRDFINNLNVHQSPVEASPTRVGQVLTSKLINGKLEAVWDDLANAPQTFNEQQKAQARTNIDVYSKAEIGGINTDFVSTINTTYNS